MCDVAGVVCSDAGFLLYGDVVSEDVDAAHYSQQLRELQNYITAPTNALPLSDVLALPQRTTHAVLHVCRHCLKHIL